jgi:hypothetical protein
MNLNSISRTLNELRVVPRALMAFYILLTWQTSQWFFALSDPSASQAGFASAVVGAGAAWFGLYVNSGPHQNSSRHDPSQKSE